VDLDQLLWLNSRGLIPGPNEGIVDFQKRAEACIAQASSFQSSLNNVQELFDIYPDWLSIIYSNRGLLPWEGGCTWISDGKKGFPSIQVQLREAFGRKSRYLGIYDKDELVAHEMIHAARMAFNEPRYEELMAYQTAIWGFRRWIGPLINSSAESCIFITAVIISMASAWIGLFFPLNAQWMSVPILFPFVIVSGAFGRLFYRQSKWKRCLKNLYHLLQDDCKARAVAFRLTDKEIDGFSIFSPKQITSYAIQESHISLRWKVIWKAYFNIS